MKRPTFPLFSFICALAILSLSACRTLPVNPTGGGTDSLSSAINGVVREGPISPVERPGVDNTAPLAHAPIGITGPNGFTAIVTSDSAGKFYVKVNGGTYVLTPKAFTSSGLPRPQSPVTVQVPKGATVTAQLDYDTGIR